MTKPKPTTPEPRSWNALVELFACTDRLKTILMETNFSRSDIRKASDDVGLATAIWLEQLNRDPDDLKATSGPWMSAEGRAELRGMLS